MSSNTEENNNNATPNSNTAESPAKITKLNPSHVAKAKLLRQKLREKKKKEESVINSNNKSNGKSPEPSSPINTSNSSSNNNITIVKPETEKVDPLKFVFSVSTENFPSNENNPISSNGIEKEKDEIKEEKVIENLNDSSNLNNENNIKKENNEKNIKKENEVNNTNTENNENNLKCRDNKMICLNIETNIDNENKVIDVNKENNVNNVIDKNNGIRMEKKEEKIQVGENNENKNDTVKESNQQEINTGEKDNNIKEEIMIQKCEKPMNDKEEIDLVPNKVNIKEPNVHHETNKKDNIKNSDEITEAKEMNKENIKILDKDTEEDKTIDEKIIMSEANIQQINSDLKSTPMNCTQSPIQNTEKQEENNSKFSVPTPPQIPKVGKKEPVKQYNFPKIVKPRDSIFTSSSSDDDDFSKKEEERLKNLKFAQKNLFKKADLIPKKNFFAAKKKEPDLTKEEVLQNLFLDFDKASELLELDEKKKQIMLKKMRRTLHRISNLRPKNTNPEEEEKRNLIKKKIEELKTMTGNDYDKIKEDVEKIVLNLKLPDFYFDDDEDVERISDKEQKVDLDFKPILEAEFITLMRQ